jgi:hypothetical protein
VPTPWGCHSPTQRPAAQPRTRPKS